MSSYNNTTRYEDGYTAHRSRFLTKSSSFLMDKGKSTPKDKRGRHRANLGLQRDWRSFPQPLTPPWRYNSGRLVVHASNISSSSTSGAGSDGLTADPGTGCGFVSS